MEKKLLDTTPDLKYLALIFSGRYQEALEYRRRKLQTGGKQSTKSPEAR